MFTDRTNTTPLGFEKHRFSSYLSNKAFDLFPILNDYKIGDGGKDHALNLFF